MANFDGTWDSEEENCIFSGPVTAKELEIRWRLLMKEKEESRNCQTPVDLNRTMDADMDDSGICPSDIPLPDDDFDSMEERSCCAEEVGAIGPAPESHQEESGWMEYAGAVEPSGSEGILEDSDKENQSLETPSQLGFQSRIPVGMATRLPKEQLPILKPGKLKFDPQDSKGNSKWEMKMKKVAQPKKPYVKKTNI